jgi:hypothetical protein
LRIDLISAIQRQIEVRLTIQRCQRDAEFARQRRRSLPMSARR